MRRTTEHVAQRLFVFGIVSEVAFDATQEGSDLAQGLVRAL